MSVKLVLEGYSHKKMNEIMNCSEYHLFIASVTDLTLSMNWCMLSSQHIKTLIANQPQLISLAVYTTCKIK